MGRGAPAQGAWAEIIPSEPDPDNAGAGCCGGGDYYRSEDAAHDVVREIEARGGGRVINILTNLITFPVVQYHSYANRFIALSHLANPGLRGKPALCSSRWLYW